MQMNDKSTVSRTQIDKSKNSQREKKENYGFPKQNYTTKTYIEWYNIIHYPSSLVSVTNKTLENKTHFTDDLN